MDGWICSCITFVVELDMVFGEIESSQLCQMGDCKMGICVRVGVGVDNKQDI